MKRTFPLFRFKFGAFMAAMFCLGGLATPEARAQVSITQLTSYTQNFDGLVNSGSWANNSTITGWYAATGSTAPTSFIASDGSTTAAGLKSYGTGGSTDRALGCVNAAGGTHYYGVRLKNNTASPIAKFIISYTAERWAKPSGNVKGLSVRFYYQKGATNLTTGTWTEQTVDALTFDTGGGKGSTLDGNLPGNRAVITFSTQLLNLAPGGEVMFRWSDSNTGGVYVGIDDITITPTNSSLFYSKSTGALTDFATWGTNTDGSGTEPANFNNGTFIIANRTATTLGASWTVTSPAKALLGEGSLTIPANFTLDGTLDVAAGTTLNIANSNKLTLGNIADNSIIVYNSTTLQTLPAASYSILTISGTGAKQLSANTTIKSKLTFSGAKLQLGNYNLTLSRGATISGVTTTSYVVTNGAGSLVQEVSNNAADVLFPVGTNAYMPVRLSQPSTGITDNFSVKAIDSVYTSYLNNSPKGKSFKKQAVNLTWIIDEEVAGGSNVTMAMEWDNTKSLTDFDASKTRISHFYNGAWDDVAPTSATSLTGRYMISRTGITSFSPFGVFSTTPTTLPVELISFNANRADKDVLCSWATASEKNNSHFMVERSADGREFKAVGKVKGNGNTSQTTMYKFLDEQAPAGLVYYRLRQVDLDGTEAFSKVVAVKKADNEQNLSVELYPNPATGTRYLKANHKAGSPVTVTVANTTGKVLMQVTADTGMLQHGFPLSLAGQPKGIYIISVQSNKEVITLRAIQD